MNEISKTNKTNTDTNIIYFVIDSDDNIICVFDSLEHAHEFVFNKQVMCRVSYRIEVVKTS